MIGGHDTSTIDGRSPGVEWTTPQRSSGFSEVTSRAVFTALIMISFSGCCRDDIVRLLGVLERVIRHGDLPIGDLTSQGSPQRARSIGP